VFEIEYTFLLGPKSNNHKTLMVKTSLLYDMQGDKGFSLENDKNREIPIKDDAGKTLHLSLEGHSTIKGKPREKRVFKINRLVWKLASSQSGRQDKIILIEEIQYLDNGYKTLRFCYRIQNQKGKWSYGQFAPFISTGDLKELLQLAKEKGLID